MHNDLLRDPQVLEQYCKNYIKTRIKNSCICILCSIPTINFDLLDYYKLYTINILLCLKQLYLLKYHIIYNDKTSKYKKLCTNITCYLSKIINTESKTKNIFNCKHLLELHEFFEENAENKTVVEHTIENEGHSKISISKDLVVIKSNYIIFKAIKELLFLSSKKYEKLNKYIPKIHRFEINIDKKVTGCRIYMNYAGARFDRWSLAVPFYEKLQIFHIIFNQICEFIKICKEYNIVHLDVKPQNICIDQYGKLTIIDWEFYCNTSLFDQYSYCGTLKYKSLAELTHESYVSIKNMMYSFGLILIEFLDMKLYLYIILSNINFIDYISQCTFPDHIKNNILNLLNGIDDITDLAYFTDANNSLIEDCTIFDFVPATAATNFIAEVSIYDDELYDKVAKLKKQYSSINFASRIGINNLHHQLIHNALQFSDTNEALYIFLLQYDAQYKSLKDLKINIHSVPKIINILQTLNWSV
jgi:thiamine kinase-like enzyme